MLARLKDNCCAAKNFSGLYKFTGCYIFYIIYLTFADLHLLKRGLKSGTIK